MVDLSYRSHTSHWSYGTYETYGTYRTYVTEGYKMFGFFKKKPANSGERKLGTGGPIIAVLLLEGDSFPIDAFLKEAARTRIADKPVVGIKRDDSDVFSFDVDDEFLALAVMPAPYPAADLNGPLATSWMWPRQPPIENVKRTGCPCLGTGQDLKKQ